MAAYSWAKSLEAGRFSKRCVLLYSLTLHEENHTFPTGLLKKLL